MNPRSPLISVVLPTFNAGETVARAIASIRAQTFADWELIVIDDGSIDATRRVLAELACSEPRMRVVERPHQGLVPALNTGIAEARGEFIARMDADDECHPDRLAEQVAFLRDPANREVGLVSCLVEFGGDRAASGGYALHVDWINSLATSEEISLNRFVEAPLAHPSVMFRRELIARHGGYREGPFPEDYELWLRWLDAGVRMAKVPRVLLRWNDCPARLSRSDRRYSPEAFFAIKAEWIARWLVAHGVLEQSGPSARSRSPLRLGCSRSPLQSPAGTPRRVFVWGAGRPTRKRAAHLERFGVRIAAYIDFDPKKATRAIGGTGRPVILPPDLLPPGEIFVLGYVTSRGAREVIRGELGRRDYVEGRDFLMCA